MTEIKTAQAWGALSWTNNEKLAAFAQPHQWSSVGFPVVIVLGLTEAEVHEAAALLEKSREVCEWVWSDLGGKYKTCGAVPAFYVANFCPSCGRKVVVK